MVEMSLKCKRCLHWYRVMARPGEGYNPYPCCHCYEDTGKRPNVLTQECYQARKKGVKQCETNSNR